MENTSSNTRARRSSSGSGSSTMAAALADATKKATGRSRDRKSPNQTDVSTEVRSNGAVTLTPKSKPIVEKREQLVALYGEQEVKFGELGKKRAQAIVKWLRTETTENVKLILDAKGAGIEKFNADGKPNYQYVLLSEINACVRFIKAATEAGDDDAIESFASDDAGNWTDRLHLARNYQKQVTARKQEDEARERATQAAMALHPDSATEQAKAAEKIMAAFHSAREKQEKERKAGRETPVKAAQEFVKRAMRKRDSGWLREFIDALTEIGEKAIADAAKPISAAK